MNVFSLLPGWQTLRIHGPESRDFLHRISSANFQSLKPGAQSPGTLLSPTGKIQIYFKAFCRASNDYLLFVPPSFPNSGFDSFDRLLFRENLKLEPQGTDVLYFRVFAESSEWTRNLPQDFLVFEENRWNEKDWSLFVPKTQEETAKSALIKAGLTETPSLEPYRISSGTPWVPAEINDTVLPLEVRLDDAVHENKGCYPGQEVIERIRSMGEPPRRLVRFEGSGPVPAAGTKVEIEKEGKRVEAGTLTSSAPAIATNGWVALGLLKKNSVADLAATSAHIGSATEIQCRVV